MDPPTRRPLAYSALALILALGVSHSVAEDLLTGAIPGANTGALQGANTGVLQGANPGAIQGALQGANPGAIQGALQGANPGALQAANPGALQGALQGANPGAIQGAVQGANPGAIQGAVQGANPGAIQGALQGANPGAIQAANPGAIQGALQGANPAALQGANAGALQVALQGAIQGPTQNITPPNLQLAPIGQTEGIIPTSYSDIKLPRISVSNGYQAQGSNYLNAYGQTQSVSNGRFPDCLQMPCHIHLPVGCHMLTLLGGSCCPGYCGPPCARKRDPEQEPKPEEDVPTAKSGWYGQDESDWQGQSRWSKSRPQPTPKRTYAQRPVPEYQDEEDLPMPGPVSKPITSDAGAAAARYQPKPDETPEYTSVPISFERSAQNSLPTATGLKVRSGTVYDDEEEALQGLKRRPVGGRTPLKEYRSYSQPDGGDDEQCFEGDQCYCQLPKRYFSRWGGAFKPRMSVPRKPEYPSRPLKTYFGSMGNSEDVPSAYCRCVPVCFDGKSDFDDGGGQPVYSLYSNRSKRRVTRK